MLLNSGGIVIHPLQLHLGSSIIEIRPLQANKTETQVATFEKLHLFGAEELLLRIHFLLHQHIWC